MKDMLGEMQQPKRILIIEDDRNIARTLEKTLTREGYEAWVARNGASGETFAVNMKPDLVILDWMLPDKEGIEVLKAIRQLAPTRVIFLTARDDVADKVRGIEAGADDYLTKPFDDRELIARVKMVLRRSEPASPSGKPHLTYGPFTVLVEERRALRDGEPLDLTRVEFDLLQHFVRNPKVVLTRELLLETVWGYSFEGYQRTVDTHIRRLRMKAEPDPEKPIFIHTVRGIGYRFELEEG